MDYDKGLMTVRIEKFGLIPGDMVVYDQDALLRDGDLVVVMMEDGFDIRTYPDPEGQLVGKVIKKIQKV